jgi:hypothetical protein
MASPVVLMRAIQEGLLSTAPRDRMVGLVCSLALPEAAQARALLADHSIRDADEQVRRLAAGCSTLLEEKIGAAAAVPPPKKLTTRFRELIEDARARIRLGALAQVLKYKGGILVELVEEAMAREEEPEVLAAMCAVLAQRGSVAHLGTIARLIGHEEAMVAAQAVRALALLGGAAMRPLLENVASASDLRVASVADEVLAHLTAHPEQGPARPVEVHQIALALTSHDQTARLKGLEAAKSHLDDPAVLGLVEVLSELDADGAVSQVAKTLMGAAEERAHSEVPTATVEVPDVSRSWAKLPPRQLAALRLRARLDHPDEAVREAALTQLKDHPVRALLPLVIEKLATEESPRVLAILIHCVGRMGVEADVPRLAAYLSHGNPAVVRAALIALWRLGGDEMQPLFLTLLTRPDERVQEQALAALLRMGPDKLLAYVMTMAKSPREEARERALTLLTRIPTPAVEDIALDMLEREQSDRMIAREMQLIARTASPRSIPLIWTVRRRRGALGDEFAGLIAQLSERWGLSIEEIRGRGDAFLDAHPEVLAPPETAAAAPPKKRRWRIVSLVEDVERGWAVAGVVAIALMAGYHLDLGGIRTDGSSGTGGEEQRMIETAQAMSHPAATSPTELPASSSFAAEVDAIAKSYLVKPEDPAAAAITELARSQLVAAGFTNEAYIDMEARGQVRGPADRAIRDARARQARNDAGGAVAVLVDALSKVEAENILVRCELARELARAYVAAKNLKEARQAARLALELARKAVAIRSATPRPGGGGMMANADDAAAIEASARHLDGAFDEAERRFEMAGSVTALTPEEIAAGKDALEKLKAEGKISAEQYAQAIAQIEGR